MLLNVVIKSSAVVFELVLTAILFQHGLNSVAVELGVLQLLGAASGMAVFAFSKAGWRHDNLRFSESWGLAAILLVSLALVLMGTISLFFPLSLVVYWLGFYFSGQHAAEKYSRLYVNMFMLRPVAMIGMVIVGVNADLILLLSLVLTAGFAYVTREAVYAPETIRKVNLNNQVLLSVLIGGIVYTDYLIVGHFYEQDAALYRLMLQLVMWPLVLQQASNQTVYDDIVGEKRLPLTWFMKVGLRAFRYAFAAVVLFHFLLMNSAELQHYASMLLHIDGSQVIGLVKANWSGLALLQLLIMVTILLGPVGLYLRLRVPARLGVTLLLGVILVKLVMDTLLVSQGAGYWSILTVSIVTLLVFNIAALAMTFRESARG